MCSLGLAPSLLTWIRSRLLTSLVWEWPCFVGQEDVARPCPNGLPDGRLSLLPLVISSPSAGPQAKPCPEPKPVVA